MLPKWAQAVGGIIIATLFGGNAFFVSRLVEQLDATRDQVWELRQAVVVLSTRLDTLNTFNLKKRRKDDE